MKPNPLASLNHFTVPCSIVFSSVLICCHAQSNWGSGRIFAENQTCSRARCLHISTPCLDSLQGGTCGRVRADERSVIVATPGGAGGSSSPTSPSSESGPQQPSP